MKKLFFGFLISTLFFVFTSGCGEDGKAGKEGKAALTFLSDEEPGENCVNGGTKIDTGLDLNGNEELEEEEILETEYLCNGENGKDGMDGTDGLDGDKGDKGDKGADGVGCTVVKDDETGITTITCAEGTEVTVSDGAKGDKGDKGEAGETGATGETGNAGADGADGDDCSVVDNENGTYTVTCGTAEVVIKDGDKGETGEPGDAGADGHNSMIVIETIDPGDEDCPSGGQLVTVGIDVDDSGTLDEGEGAVTQKICNGIDGEDGSDGYTSLVEVAPDAETCPAGGHNIKTGIDTNGNGTLDADPNEVVSSVFICNGIAGEDGIDGKSATVSITTLLEGEEGCVAGGYKIEIGIEGGSPETVVICHGEKGDKGDKGDSCTVSDNGDGTKTIACEDGTEVTVYDGADGTTGDKGDSCTVSDNGDGTKTITCEDGTEVTVYDGADGADGTDGVCAGNNAPVINSIVVDGTTFSGTPVEVGKGDIFNVTVNASDADSDPLTYNIIAGQVQITDNGGGSYTVTVDKDGFFYFSTVVSDGCRITTGSFSVKTILPWESINPDSDTSSNVNGLVVDQSNGNLFIAQARGGSVIIKQYNTVTESWDDLGGTLPFNIYGSSLLAFNGELYLNNGQKFYQFNFGTNAWDVKADVGYPTNVSKSFIRKAPDGTIYAGGISSTNYKVTVRVYDKTGNSWSTVGAEAFTSSAYSGYNGHGFAIDDVTGELYAGVLLGSSTNDEEIEIYKFSEGSWISIGKPTTTQAYHGSYFHLKAHNGVPYAGYYYSGFNVRKYVAGSWQNVGSSFSSEQDHAFTVVDGEFYIFSRRFVSSSSRVGRVMKLIGGEWTRISEEIELGDCRDFAIAVNDGLTYTACWSLPDSNATKVQFIDEN